MKNRNNFPDVICVRHGKQIWDINQIINGEEDSLLAEAGEEQAKKAGCLLAQYLFNEKNIKVVSSHLQRAQKTAEYIVESFVMAGEETERQVSWTVDNLLRERYYGDYSKHRDFILGSDGQVDKEKVRQLGLLDDAESEDDLRKRAKDTFEKIISAYADFDVIIIVGHSRFFEILLKDMAFPVPENSITHCKVMKLEWSERKDCFAGVSQICFDEKLNQAVKTAWLSKEIPVVTELSERKEETELPTGNIILYSSIFNSGHRMSQDEARAIPLHDDMSMKR